MQPTVVTRNSIIKQFKNRVRNNPEDVCFEYQFDLNDVHSWTERNLLISTMNVNKFNKRLNIPCRLYTHKENKLSVEFEGVMYHCYVVSSSESNVCPLSILVFGTQVFGMVKWFKSRETRDKFYNYSIKIGLFEERPLPEEE